MNEKRSGMIAVVALALAGCSAEYGDGEYGDATSPELYNRDLAELGTAEQPLIGGDWVPAPGNGVVQGDGGGRGPLTVCRAFFDGGQHPGKVWDGTCNYGWGGISHYAAQYEVLLDRGYHWQMATVSGLPANAVDGGPAGNAAGNVRLGVCEVFNGGDSTWHPGKWYAGRCNYAWGGSKTDLLGAEYAALPNGNVRLLVR